MPKEVKVSPLRKDPIIKPEIKPVSFIMVMLNTHAFTAVCCYVSQILHPLELP